MNLHKMFARLTIERKPNEELFGEIIGCEDIKRLFRMALGSAEPVHILLSGAPTSAKTLFLQSLITLKDCYFVDGSNTTKSGMIDYIFGNEPKYLLIDEIDKMAGKDQTFLLNLMETGIISETKYGKTRMTQTRTWVFATSNNVSKLMLPLQSRFFVVNLESYTYEQFYNIVVRLLTEQYRVKEEIAKTVANVIWDTSADIRDCVKIGRMAKSLEDVMFIADTFLKYTPCNLQEQNSKQKLLT